MESIRLLQFVSNCYVLGTNGSSKPFSVVDATERWLFSEMRGEERTSVSGGPRVTDLQCDLNKMRGGLTMSCWARVIRWRVTNQVVALAAPQTN